MMPRHPNNPNLDRFWRKRQILKMSAHFYGRAQNCYSIAIRRVQRALQYVAVGRKLRKVWHTDVWESRISAGCEELGNIPQGSSVMLESLARSQVLLNRQSLANLAIWEPRTFKAINAIAAEKAKSEKVTRNMGPLPSILKGDLP
jgi:large subunit ribosomal protein L20